ncbi:MAG: diadenylate cyclase, partial [Bacteroidales bacterium]|nr:diadenylate cyclase [Candidatus Equibacterium intestinale]
TIMEQVLGVGLIALIVIFQPEIRRFLLKLGTELFSARKKGSGRIRSFFKKYKQTSLIDAATLEEITAACSHMSQTKTGALIVLQHVSALNSFIETGDTINGTISCRLLESIFFKNSPLHDGAAILSSDRILAARCTLPISDSQDIHPRYGMRHRAAVGITEITDAHAIVVSEETGEISYVKDGVIKTMSSITELRLAIEKSFEG